MALGPMRHIPHLYRRYYHFMEGMQKIEEFLNIPEVDHDCLVSEGSSSSKYAIKIENNSFSWGVTKDEDYLKKK